jgi:membrane-bound lytic murein transglycosylase A
VIPKRYGITLRAALFLSLIGCAIHEGGPQRPAGSARTAVVLRHVGFGDLPGWRADQVSRARAAIEASCDVLLRQWDRMPVGPEGMAGTVADWRPACAAMPPSRAVDETMRKFVESSFQAFAVAGGDGSEGLFTGYYEPELAASRMPGPGFSVPLYSRPPDLVTIDLDRFRADLAGESVAGRVVAGRLEPYATRAEIEGGALSGQGLELFWLADRIDAFFLHVQGSGRLRLAEGGAVRVGYATSNGQAYTSIGRLLIERGALTRETATLQAVRDWLHAHPAEAGPLMQQNARYVFFKEIGGDGPVGANGVSLTAGRSLAIDATLLPLGAPLWLDTTYPEGTLEAGQPLQRLVVAQDTGAAIKGAVRGDLFWGTGDRAMRYAGPMKQRGRYFLLLPNAVAERRDLGHDLRTGTAPRS